jgi:hypothetical protein
MIGFAACPLGKPGHIAMHDAFDVEEDGGAPREACEKSGCQGVDRTLSLRTSGCARDKEMLAELGLGPVHASDLDPAPSALA